MFVYHRSVVIAHHLIWTAYGWWLPNDPRGSTSHRIRQNIVTSLGEIHHGRKTVQPAGWEIRAFYNKAPSVLKHALLTISPDEREIIAASFAETIAARKYTCYACAIMGDHVHMLIRKHRDTAEQMIANLQESSRDALRRHGSRPSDHPVWGGPGWKVFQDHPDDIRRTIPYIEDNPVKMRMPRQQWAFIKDYDGWPLHEGHNPNSPYAKRQRGEPFKKK
jgi:REP element-mobilizing transposase RayT